MLVTVDTGKDHLRDIRELLPRQIGRLLKDGVEHLAEPTPVIQRQRHQPLEPLQ